MDPVRHGELIALGGKHAGVGRPLGAAVTVVGSDAACDIRLTAPGVEPVHCLIAATPAGLALRSLCPDRTRVNGAVTAARLLADGDELTVGPLRFRVELPAELVPLVEAPPDDVELQEAALAKLICARQEQFGRWAAELADNREVVRQLRAKVEAATDAAHQVAGDRLNQADRLVLNLKADRARVKRLAVRFVGRLRRRYAADRADLIAGKRTLRAEQERFHADAHALKERLTRGWELLTDGQKRLVADRQAIDTLLTDERRTLDTRTAELAAETAARAQNQARVETRVEQLLGEIARLDARATASRAAVEKLERDRVALQPPAAPGGPLTTVVPYPDRVPLVLTPAAAAGELLGELAVREREMVRTEASHDAARHELAMRAAVLHDDRLVLAEQVTMIARARQVWQATECQVVAELEEFARGLGRHELALVSRERQVAAREDAARDRTAELDAARVKLEGWLTLLSGYEAAALADRDRLLAQAVAKRAHLEEWERTLGGLSRKWNDEHDGMTRTLRTEVAGWHAERQRLADAVTALDYERSALADAAAKVAAEAVAAEEAAQSLIDGPAGPQAERRLRVLRSGWERHFKQHARELDARRLAAVAAAEAADERCRELGRRAADAADRERAAATAERQAEADRLAKGRALDDRAVTLSFEAAKMHHTRRELDQARGEVETLARRLIGDAVPQLKATGSRIGVVALEAA